MIDDLQLNSYHHLKKRTQWLKALSHAIENSSGAERENLITYICSRERELLSIDYGSQPFEISSFGRTSPDYRRGLHLRRAGNGVGRRSALL